MSWKVISYSVYFGGEEACKSRGETCEHVQIKIYKLETQQDGVALRALLAPLTVSRDRNTSFFRKILRYVDGFQQV